MLEPARLARVHQPARPAVAAHEVEHDRAHALADVEAVIQQWPTRPADGRRSAQLREHLLGAQLAPRLIGRDRNRRRAEQRGVLGAVDDADQVAVVAVDRGPGAADRGGVPGGGRLPPRHGLAAR